MNSSNKIKALNKKLFKAIDDKLQKINQDISIQDIYIYNLDEKFSLGESNYYLNTSYDKIPELERIIDQIQLISDIANQYHQQQYCKQDPEKKYQIREDAINKITRALLPEFFFYTRKPISLKNFNLIYEAVSEIARQQHSNVHLLLSSFPVKINYNTVLNMSLYVQCGYEPIISQFAKISASHIDPEYINTDLFEAWDNNKHRNNNSSEFFGRKRNESIPAQSAFKVTTKGGAEFVLAIDICLDHTRQRAKILTEQIGNNTLKSIADFMPEQVDQILTSNSIEVHNNAVISNHLTHIDPNNSYFQIFPPYGPKLLETNFKPEVDPELKLKYPLLNFKTKNPYPKIHAPFPPFGSSFAIFPTKERKLDRLKKIGAISINEINTHAKNMTTKKLLATQHVINPELAEQSIAQATRTIIMLKMLLENCILQLETLGSKKETIFEKIIGKSTMFFDVSYTKDEQMKAIKEVIAAIKDTKQNFYALEDNLIEAFFNHKEILFSDLLLKISHLDSNNKIKFISDLKAEIENLKSSFSPATLSL